MLNLVKCYSLESIIVKRFKNPLKKHFYKKSTLYFKVQGRF
ncbi:hypothetical protein CLJ_B2448 [Clostridium botulinum Ba4 str. 657]|uniref:Uncharacterized protein n=1 Tax=Clostridium botulinum (strain 657 / Type Ba4) TaxID=515621 RepID=A0A3F2ZTR1_CLOB6|nr:hypothetical protein CLJ_B2448 [Clostridium botulinum Ba4 str. 657]